ncbi:MAG: PAS domain S-box protein [Desulfobacteraceae bacterium]|jgi:PAS domain S-box-containing protein
MTADTQIKDLQLRIKELEEFCDKCLKSEQMLRRSNQLIKSILAHSAIGFGLVENQTFVEVNEAMRKLFGFDRKRDFHGMGLDALYPAKADYERVACRIEEALRAGEAIQLDTTFQRRDGATFPGHLKISTLDPTNPMRRAVISVSDISWRKKLEAELIEKEKLQGVIEMAGAICHELNQPIQVATFEFSQVLEDPDLPLKHRVDLAKVKRQIDKIGTITGKLMRITRYETCEYIEGRKIIDIDRASGVTS